MTEARTIVNLSASNILRLEAVNISPDGAMVIIGGENGAGKTSVLDSLAMALSGGKSVPPEPIHRGAERGEIVIDLGDLVVRRWFTTRGPRLGTLEVTGADGVAKKRPQALLDRLTGALTFDPLAFMRMAPLAQSTELRDLVGLDTTEIDAEIVSAFEIRAVANSAVDHSKEVLAEMARPPEERPDHVDTKALVAAQQEAVEHNDRIGAIAGLCAAALSTRNATYAAVKRAEAELQRAAKTLEHDEQNYSAAKRDVDQAGEVRPTDGLQAQLNAAGVDNRIVELGESWDTQEEKLQVARRVAQSRTETLHGMRANRQKMIEALTFPIDGLSLVESEVRFKGLPLEQASGAEQLRISASIAIAMNPKLRVMLVRDGSLLDESSLKLLAEIAESHEAQVWIERVGDRDESAVVLEDGHVRGEG